MRARKRQGRHQVRRSGGVSAATRPGALGPAGCALAETAFAVLYRSGVVVASIAIGRGGVFRREDRIGPCGPENAKEDDRFDNPAECKDRRLLLLSGCLTVELSGAAKPRPL